MPRWRWSGWCRRTSLRLRRDGSATPSSPMRHGGILDDLMVANFGDHLFLVVNAACKAEDEAHLRAHLSDVCVIEPLADRALIALQGPKAEAVLAKFCAGRARDALHGCRPAHASTASTASSRAPATPARTASRFRCRPNRPRRWPTALLDNPRRAADRARRARQPAARGRALPLRPRHRHHDHAGRGRAGMVGPEEPPQRRRARRRFSGADKILAQFEQGASRRRVGLRPEGRAPVREGAPLFADATSSEPIGAVTSGGFGPSLNAPVAMGYLPVVARQRRHLGVRRSARPAIAAAGRAHALRSTIPTNARGSCS